ncbi:hypothetical protein M408DRAFT_325439 [Serendipita vermifera MAFF 305830]|uniref:D-lactate dehydratase n=1 Tax=Serendipita vermifera MAFF 305830 TaxID=933852 RepID=A0A0C2XYC2_SERVB|nr:hypothetical protein M408DRAFT_325439 [Serendipita vermifera MAFF 305830]
MPTALVLIANGTEEMEFTITLDTLVRAGIECTSAFVPSASEVGLSSSGGWGVNEVLVTCSRGIKITADTTLDAVLAQQGKVYDAIVIPGGAKGADTLSQSEAVQKLVKAQYDGGKLVGMICAGSLVAKMSKLPKQPLTSHPSVKSYLDQDYEYKEDSVVTSGKLITSRGPGTAFPFAFEIIRQLCGEEKVKEVEGPMIFPKPANA